MVFTGEIFELVVEEPVIDLLGFCFRLIYDVLVKLLMIKVLLNQLFHSPMSVVFSKMFSSSPSLSCTSALSNAHARTIIFVLSSAFAPSIRSLSILVPTLT